MPERRSRTSVARTETFSSRFLVGRIYLLATLLLAEYALLVSFPHPWSHLHRVVAICLVFAAVFLCLIPRRLQGYNAPIRFHRTALALHAVSILLVLFCHRLLAVPILSISLVSLWYAGILAAAFTLLFGLLPWQAIRYTLDRTRIPLAYAAGAAVIAGLLSDTIRSGWTAPSNSLTRGLQTSTLHLVGSVLQRFYPDAQADPATYIVTLPNFQVIIGDACSGIEGLALTLLFCLGWFWYARRELRFPRAFLILPLALLLSYAFNVLRIVVLLAIGNAGHPDLAIQSFHSEAGWIAFNFIALTFLALTSRIAFFLRPSTGTLQAGPAPTQPAASDAISIYLLPFLVFLGSGFVTRAFSPAGVEWLYPLRLLACSAVFLLYRRTYRRVRWNPGWLSITVGIAVFAVWIPLAHRFGASAQPSFVRAIHDAPPGMRSLWIALRLVGSILVVPIAEELAFRGYLLRRLSSVDFIFVRYTRTTMAALLLSSIAFGAMHGKLWLPAILAGLAFGWLARKTGRLAPAIAAHATANLLLSLWVLLTGDWGLW